MASAASGSVRLVTQDPLPEYTFQTGHPAILIYAAGDGSSSRDHRMPNLHSGNLSGQYSPIAWNHFFPSRLTSMSSLSPEHVVSPPLSLQQIVGLR